MTPPRTPLEAHLKALMRKLFRRATWAASDKCPGDFYPQDAFGECIDELRAALASVEPQKTLDIEAMRANLHATFNGGHHDEPAHGAFHHGMDTVCNVLAAQQKGENTNGILLAALAQKEQKEQP